jgi:hypothetical protein
MYFVCGAWPLTGPTPDHDGVTSLVTTTGSPSPMWQPGILRTSKTQPLVGPAASDIWLCMGACKNTSCAAAYTFALCRWWSHTPNNPPLRHVWPILRAPQRYWAFEAATRAAPAQPGTNTVLGQRWSAQGGGRNIGTHTVVTVVKS